MKNTYIDHSEIQNLPDNLCTIQDDFIKDKAGWVAVLSNGLIIFQDDGRPNCNPPSAWIRLGEYIRKNRLRIAEFHLQYRSHIECPVPKYAAGYFFCHKCCTAHGASESAHFYLCGHLVRETVELQLWKIPELVLCQRSVRIAEACKKDRLIVNEAYRYEPFLGEQTA